MDEPQAPLTEREFSEWLNDRRGLDVSTVFHDIVLHYRAALASAPRPPSNTLGVPASPSGSLVAGLPTIADAAGGSWVRMEDAAPPPDTDCVLWVRYSPGPGHFAIDRWEMQREDPIGMGGPTIETGYGWNDNFESDVIYWLALAPVPDADYDSRDLPTSEASRDL